MGNPCLELKDFVRITIEHIVKGAASAQEAVQSKGTMINPTRVQFQKDGSWNTYKNAMPQNVEFDVALTSTDISKVLLTE